MSEKTLAQWLQDLNQQQIDLGLDRLKAVIGRLNLAQSDATIITVGGTNGKGSTVAMLQALLRQKGLQVGAFTSPHIHRFNERIVVNGQMADDAEITAAFTAITQARGEIHLSYFEHAFLAALLIFKQQGVDVMVLEVGLGGRLDATNAVDSDVAIITTIDYDHTDWLGTDLEQIGKEKAGIMRSDRAVIFGSEHMPHAIRSEADRLGAHLHQWGVAFTLQAGQGAYQYQWQSEQPLRIHEMPVSGVWQQANLACALSALRQLGHVYATDEVAQAWNLFELKGRMEIKQSAPLVIADVAHNAQSARQLAQWLQAHPCDGETRAVFSVLADKQPANWLHEFSALVDHWFVFKLGGERAMPMQDMKLALLDQVSLLSVFDTGQDAYEWALKASKPEDRVVVFGSFHVLEAVFADAN